MDAAAQKAKWARLEETLNKKKKGGRHLNLDPAKVIKKAKKAAKHHPSAGKTTLLEDAEALKIDLTVPTQKKSAKKSRPLCVKEKARLALEQENLRALALPLFKKKKAATSQTKALKPKAVKRSSKGATLGAKHVKSAIKSGLFDVEVLRELHERLAKVPKEDRSTEKKKSVFGKVKSAFKIGKKSETKNSPGKTAGKKALKTSGKGASGEVSNASASGPSLADQEESLFKEKKPGVLAKASKKVSGIFKSKPKRKTEAQKAAKKTGEESTASAKKPSLLSKAKASVKKAGAKVKTAVASKPKTSKPASASSEPASDSATPASSSSSSKSSSKSSNKSAFGKMKSFFKKKK